MVFDAADMLAGLFDAPAVPVAALAALGEVFLDTAPEPAPGPYADWVQAPDTRGRVGLQSPDAPVLFPAWEDLPEWCDGAPAEPGAGPCYWCGRRAWWRSIHGAVVCGYCHPPAVPGLVAERLNESATTPPRRIRDKVLDDFSITV